jgi:hypothetical protein
MSARPEVASWAGKLPMESALCRDLLHAWQPKDAWWDKDRKEYRRVLKCARCTTERWSWVTTSGIQYGNRYKYPQGYRAPDGTGFLSKDERGAIRLRAMGI